MKVASGTAGCEAELELKPEPELEPEPLPVLAEPGARQVQPAPPGVDGRWHLPRGSVTTPMFGPSQEAPKTVSQYVNKVSVCELYGGGG